MNLFNIGMAFLTLSLSSRLVTAKQRYEKAETENAELGERVEMLKELVVSLGGTVPTDEAKAAAAAAAEEAAKLDAERVKKTREEEARALTALATADNDEKPKKKGVLI
jgi:alcohol dehydrogenase class IV